MHYAMSVSGGWKQSVKWLCVIGLMILLPSVGSASSEKPQSEKQLDPLSELFYLDTIDALTVDLAECKEALELTENPPECDDGFPWLVVIVSLAAGYVVKDLVE